MLHTFRFNIPTAIAATTTIITVQNPSMRIAKTARAA